MVNARPSSVIPTCRGIDSLCQLGPAQFIPADNKSEWMCAYVLSDNAVCVYLCMSEYVSDCTTAYVLQYFEYSHR